MDPSSLEEVIQRYGMEAFQRFYGGYRGVVTRNDDPESRGRIQALVPRSMGKRAALDAWIDPVTLQSGQNRGFFWPPELGDLVWVYFDNGDPDRPMGYLGGWFSQTGQKAALPSELAYTKKGSTVVGPDRRGFVTRGGHTFIFDDTPDQESIQLTWHKPDVGDASRTDRSKTANRSSGKTAFLTFKKDGSIELVNGGGARITIDATSKELELEDENGNILSMTKTGITLESKGKLTLKGTSLEADFASIELGKGAISPAVKGDVFSSQYAPHTHIATTLGAPTTPPVPVLSPSALTTIVKMK